MLMFCPGAEPPPPPPPAGFFEVDVLGDDAEDESVVDVSERDGGLAPATLGNAVVATIPAPIPSATANAPTRPMYFALPILTPPDSAQSTLTRLLAFASGA
jgi:hypothetical protein